MDWEQIPGIVLREGYLLKTAGGQQGVLAGAKKKGCSDARESSAKFRYFRLVQHTGVEPNTFVLYYHDTPTSKTQKGHFDLGPDTEVKQGWGNHGDDDVGSGGGGGGSARNSARSLLGQRSSSGSLAQAFASSRSASGSIAQAIAASNTAKTSMRVVNPGRTLYLMSPPREEGDDSTDDAHEWFEAFVEVRTAARDAVIARPTNVKTVAKVEFDAASQTFAGVPDNIAEDFVKAAFNLPLTQTTFVTVPGYGSPGVPLMLVLLREFLVKLQGHKAEGIFRVAPEKQECERAKRAACLRNREDLEYVLSPHVFSTLIKQWLRDLPGGLLNQLGQKLIAQASEDGFPADPETGILGKLDPIRRAIFLWLLDTLALPVRHSALTKMDSKNIAICVSPNLWETSDSADPMAALVLSQQLCKFMANCIEWRMATTEILDPAEGHSPSDVPAPPATTGMATAVGGPPLGLAPPLHSVDSMSGGGDAGDAASGRAAWF